MLCHAMPCYGMLSRAMLCSAMPCYGMPSYAIAKLYLAIVMCYIFCAMLMRCYAMRCDAMPCYVRKPIRHSAILGEDSILLYCHTSVFPYFRPSIEVTWCTFAHAHTSRVRCSMKLIITRLCIRESGDSI